MTLPQIPGLTTRRFVADRDYPLVAELVATVNVHDNFASIPTAASLRSEWEHTEGRNLDADVMMAEVDGALIGYTDLQWRVRGMRVFHQIEIAVRPDFRRRGLGGALLAWAEARVASGLAAGELGADLDLAHVLFGWSDPEIAGVAALAARAGYEVEGYGMMMARQLADPIDDAPLPEGVDVRAVRPEDHRRIWDADTEAFRDHRDPAIRTEADFLGAFADPETDTSIWEVAWEGEEVAGSVMNTIYAEENERLGVKRGWLEHISVRRPWRKRGLASALIVRSLRRLRDMGLDEAALGADTENLTGAVRLYERLGFRRVQVTARYTKRIEVPGRSGR